MPVTRSFDVYFDLRPNKRLSKQSRGWWFETLSSPLWRHRNVFHWPRSVLARDIKRAQVSPEDRFRWYIDTLIAGFMGPTWDLQDPGGPHIGPINLAIWVYTSRHYYNISSTDYFNRYMSGMTGEAKCVDYHRRWWSNYHDLTNELNLTFSNDGSLMCTRILMVFLLQQEGITNREQWTRSFGCNDKKHI